MIIVKVGRHKPLHGGNPQLCFQVRRQVIDEAVRIGVDGRGGGIATVDKEGMPAIILDDIGIGARIGDLINMGSNLPECGLEILVGPGVKQLVEPFQVALQSADGLV